MNYSGGVRLADQALLRKDAGGELRVGSAKAYGQRQVLWTGLWFAVPESIAGQSPTPSQDPAAG